MFSMEAVSDAARATLSRQSSVSPTTPHPVSNGGAGAGGDGRLSSFVGGGDVDALQNAMAARSSTVGGVAKAVWSRNAATRHKGTPQTGGGSTPGTKQLSVLSSGVGGPTRTLSPNVRPLSPAPTPSSSQKIVLNHLSVEETIHCRTVFDRYTTVDTAQPALYVGGGGGATLAEPSGIQATVCCALDVFTVTALLHHCRILPSVPPDVELRRIILRVAIANAAVVAKPTKSVAASATAVEPVVEFPTELTFPLFLQLVELAKRWLIREDDEDEAARAFAFLSKNRKYIKAVDEAAVQSILSAGKWSGVQQMLGLNSAAGSSFSVHTHAISPSMFDLEANGSFFGGSANTGAPQPSSNPPAASSLSVTHLRDVLKSVGAEYDFDTLFASVDPTFEKSTAGSKVDQRLFRWIAGIDDPDIVRAFMSLGGEEALSGTITVDRLIAKCEAMQMTPQYIANFVALVDPNQDGVVDFTEFLSLLVRNRQELSGERKSKLTERGNGAYGGFRFGTAGPNRTEAPPSTGGAVESKNGMPVSPLPFPRQKRFSRNDPAAESAAARRASVLPFQGLDEEDLDDAERNHLAFQEKVQSIFSGADTVMLDDEEDEVMRSSLDPPQGNNLKRIDSGELNDSFASANSEEESPRSRATKKRMSIQETHLGIGLAGMLQGKTERHDRPPVTLTERLDMAVKKGVDTIAQQRSRVDAAMHELEKRKQRKFIRTDDGLVEGNRAGGESALQQRHRMKVLRMERASRRATVNAKPLSARVVAMSEQAVTQLQRDVHRMIAHTTPHQPPRAASPRCLGAPPAAAEAAADGHNWVAEEAAGALVSGGRCASQSEDVAERLRGPHKTTRMFRGVPRAVSPRTTPHSDGRNTSNAVGNRHNPLDDNTSVRPPPTATIRPPTPIAAPSRPSTAASVRPSSSNTGMLPQRPCETPAPPTTALGAVSSSAPEEAYRKVKLEDPLSLWKLLDTNRRRLNREHAVEQPDDIRSSGHVQEGLATRRAFARTIASHLALRQSYDDDHLDVCGAQTPAAIHQAYILGAPQPKAHTLQRPGSNAHLQRTATAAANSTIAASTPRKRPHRPQTAPSVRRPVSARTSNREAQLNRPTNQSPQAPSIALPIRKACTSLSRPTSAVSSSGVPHYPKQYGVGGLLDVDDAGDDSEEVVYV